MREQGLAGQFTKRFRLTRTEPLTTTSGGYDSSRPHRAGSTSGLFMGTGSPTGRENTKRPLAVVRTLVT